MNQDLRRRLEEAELWDEFCERREELKAEGLRPQDANRQAEEEFRARLDSTSSGEPVTSSSTTKCSSMGYEGLKAQVDRKRTATYVDVVGFVFEALPLEWDEIEPESVPSIGALGLLQWAKNSKLNENKFRDGIWTKLIPSKSIIDKGTGWADDERTDDALAATLATRIDPASLQTNMADRFSEDPADEGNGTILQAAGAEESIGQHPLPPEDSA